MYYLFIYLFIYLLDRKKNVLFINLMNILYIILFYIFYLLYIILLYVGTTRESNAEHILV